MRAVNPDVDPAKLWDEFHSRIEHTSTAVKIIGFVFDHWWVILLVVLFLILRPRRRSS